MHDVEWFPSVLPSWHSKLIRSPDIEPPPFSDLGSGCVFGFLLFFGYQLRFTPSPFFSVLSIRRRVVLSVSSCIGIRSAVASLGTLRFGGVN